MPHCSHYMLDVKERNWLNSAAFNTITLDVHNINKQDMQNNICIIGVELNAQKVFLSYKFMCRNICAAHQLRHR